MWGFCYEWLVIEEVHPFWSNLKKYILNLDRKSLFAHLSLATLRVYYFLNVCMLGSLSPFFYDKNVYASMVLVMNSFCGC